MTPFSTDEFFMKRCIELARLGAGNVAPNPKVGAVVVYEHKIIGEGYHQHYGGPHAEVNAIASVSDQSLLKKATIYVNLEPCAHHGKTPPCADLIIKQQIPRVVIGMQDPFAKVNGEGIRRLIQAGRDVISGILNKECLQLNREFITYHTKNRPYIILKWAQTKDGFIDKIRTTNETALPNWITNESCRTLVHKWRAETQAILVGTNTAYTDNPSLNTRLWEGKSPLRIVFDRNLRLPKTLNLYNQKIETWVVNELKEEEIENLKYVKLNFNHTLLTNLMHKLYLEDISSIIIEGGQQTLQHFIDEQLWDEARIFIGNICFNEGIKAPQIKGKITDNLLIQNNKLQVLLNKHN